MNLEEEVMKEIREYVGKGVAQYLLQYDSAFVKTVDQVFRNYEGELKELLTECLTTSFADESFREGIKSETRSKLAKILVQRFGGELEQTVNKLKSDPATRAKITVAIDSIINEQLTGGRKHD